VLPISHAPDTAALSPYTTLFRSNHDRVGKTSCAGGSRSQSGLDHSRRGDHQATGSDACWRNSTLGRLHSAPTPGASPLAFQNRTDLPASTTGWTAVEPVSRSRVS